jgi:hypothetical protein
MSDLQGIVDFIDSLWSTKFSELNVSLHITYSCFMMILTMLSRSLSILS